MSGPTLLDALLSPGPEPALISSAGELWSRTRLDEEANRIANALLRAGLRPGDRAGLYMERSPEAVAAMIGCLRAGAVYVPIDPSSPAQRANLIVQDCGMRCMVTSRQRREAWSLAQAPIFVCEWQHASASAPPRPSVRPEELAYILYTSGSTGAPKGVMLTHVNAMAFVAWAQALIELGPSDRVASVAPFHFDLSVFDVYASLRSGATLVLLPDPSQVSPAVLVEQLRARAISVWYSVPSVLTLMLDSGGLEDGRATPKLRTVFFAGEVFPLPQLRRLMSAVPSARCFNLFGPTETNVCLFHALPAKPAADVSSLPIGQAAAGAQVTVIDDSGALIPPAQSDTVGELCIDGPALMLGYWGGPGVQRPYPTGDRVAYGANGELYYHGRKDDMVKVRGFRIELGEVEAALYRHPEVKEAAVVVQQQKLSAAIVPRVLDRPPAMLALLKHLSNLLPQSMIPEHMRFIAKLPRTTTGKVIDLNYSPCFNLGPERTVDRPLHDPIRKFIVEKLLNGDGRGLDDDSDLIEAGALRSLTMLELTAFLERSFGIRIAPKQVVPQSFRSLNAIVKLVEDARKSAKPE